MTRPTFLYKYRKDEPNSLDALFSCKAIFSGRKAFNDPFDARVELVEPTLNELAHIDFVNRVSMNPDTRGTPRFVERNTLTKKGGTFLRKLCEVAENLIDSYRFLCLSANPTSTPMWAHYASNHTGFVIEFKSEFVFGDKVVYRDEITGIPLANFLADQRHPQIGIDIWEALRTKHTSWSYEEEYRIQPSNQMHARMIAINAQNHSAKYEPEW